ncbi:phosphopantetheine-binding protein [Neotabrizicola sp. sgz301269]|uniref:phosphopantetheine-binding protein n=1 Tax=Neotabrizicola sp. sgz301269 TaxID=3276282 RepID=UPI00377069FE
MNGEIAEKVIGILAAQALISPQDIAVEATVESLGLDSLGLVEAIFAIEEEFDIAIPFDPADPSEAPAFDAESVESIIRAVSTLVARKNA